MRLDQKERRSYDSGFLRTRRRILSRSRSEPVRQIPKLLLEIEAMRGLCRQLYHHCPHDEEGTQYFFAINSLERGLTDIKEDIFKSEDFRAIGIKIEQLEAKLETYEQKLKPADDYSLSGLLAARTVTAAKNGSFLYLFRNAPNYKSIHEVMKLT